MTPALRSILRTNPPAPNFYVGSTNNAILLSASGTLYPHIPRIDFALDTPGWDANFIDALSATLTYFADIFFLSFKLDYGAYSLRPFEIKVTLGDTSDQIVLQQTERSPFQEGRRCLGPLLLPASFSLPRARGEIPSYASRRNPVVFGPVNCEETE